MLVQDPLSGYLHEIPDALAYYQEAPDALAYYGDYGDYGDYGYGYYNGYDEYLDPNMAEYPAESGGYGLFPGILSKIVGAVTGGGGAPPLPIPPLPLPVPLPFQPTGAAFVPSPGMREYIASVVKEVLAQTQPTPGQMFNQGGYPARRRRRR